MKPLIIVDSNLSRAWAKGFLKLMEPGADKRHPAVITINVGDQTESLEDENIRSALDQSLVTGSHSTCGTVANTIFPLSYWNPKAPDDAEALFARYDRAWPGIKKCPANKYGVYFRRLTAYTPATTKAKETKSKEEPINQLRHIIATYKGGNHRKSALHAAIFDPTKDHTNSRQKGFPCLQQVAFTPIGDGTMAITGFYATQFQYEKAYGNYLGLERLGRFMAKQLGLRLVQVVCVASIVERGEPSKQSLEPLAERLRIVLAKCGVALDGDGA